MTIMNNHDGQGDEYDPCEVSPLTRSDEASGGDQPKFEEVVNHVNNTTESILHSKGFWSANKYLGSPNLGIKVKKWMGLRVTSEKIVEKNWTVLRRVVKEALRYRRQNCVSGIQQAFTGAYDFARSSLLCF